MIPSELNLLDVDGNKITISAENIKSLQAHLEVTPIDVGRISIAGPASEYVLVTTSTGSHKIPRRADNDSELLTFILSQKSIS